MSRFSVHAHDATLPIGDFAKRTGVTVGTLRAWEARYGFPEPVRLASGHRRYRESDVSRVLDVVHQRQRGVSLPEAVERTRPRPDATQTSIFAGVRARFPELASHVVSKRAMFAISRAIEDECCAAAGQPVVLGAFQSQRFYERSRDRWRDLSRTALFMAAFANFPRNRKVKGGPIEVALPSGVPMHREWVVVCDASPAGAVLAGWELPGQSRAADLRRRFEAVWSADPEIVREATRISLRLIAAYAPDESLLTEEDLPDVSTDHQAALRRTTSLTNRMIAKFDR